MADVLLDTQEAAARLAVSPSTIRRLVDNGGLPKVVIGGAVRYRESDINAIIQKGAGRRTTTTSVTYAEAQLKLTEALRGDLRTHT